MVVPRLSPATSKSNSFTSGGCPPTSRSLQRCLRDSIGVLPFAAVPTGDEAHADDQEAPQTKLGSSSHPEKHHRAYMLLSVHSCLETRRHWFSLLVARVLYHCLSRATLVLI